MIEYLIYDGDDVVVVVVVVGGGGVRSNGSGFTNLVFQQGQDGESNHTNFHPNFRQTDKHPTPL